MRNRFLQLMKSLHSGSEKYFFAGQITNIKLFKTNHSPDAACIQTKIFSYCISVADTSSVRSTVFYLKVVSANFKVYGMNVFSVPDNDS